MDSGNSAPPMRRSPRKSQKQKTITVWRDGFFYPFPKGFVTFTLNAQGKVDEMKIDVPNPDFDFTELEFKRAPEAAASNGN